MANPTLKDFFMSRFEDGALVVELTSPTNIGGQSIQFDLVKRLGASASGILFSKFAASGYGGGQSGITIVNSGAGILSVRINSIDTSGLEFGNYAFELTRTTSGSYQSLVQGYLGLVPTYNG